MRKVLMRWQAHSTFGWGVLGLNLFQNWAGEPGLQPLMGLPIAPRDLAGIDPLRFALLQPAITASNQALERLNAGALDLRQEGVVVIEAFGNGFASTMPLGVHIGARNIARCILESTRLDGIEVIDAYDEILCASNWSAELLRAASHKPVTMIHEGIDHSLFYPGPRSGVLDPDCFYVFTGGKVELRKGHDLVILAFREFAARHDDAVLVAAWNSPWPQFSLGFQGKLAVPLRADANGQLGLREWVTENGIPAQQFISLPMVPNFLMPAVLREMDCTVQVSRCEACTNLPAKEAMACGVPVILADNTGMRDIVDGQNCIAMTSQGPVTGIPGTGTEGWGESRVEEIVQALENLYTDTQLRKRIGARGAEWIVEQRRTWRDHASALKTHILSLV